jgi:hypothetical protein
MERIKIEDGKGTVARERRELRALYGIHRSDALSRLLDSCENEAHLNANLQLLINRLHIQRDREKSPRIAEKAIIAPLFITGLPRTGATLLRGLLAQEQTPINGAVIAASSISDAGSAERLRVLLADDHPAIIGSRWPCELRNRAVSLWFGNRCFLLTRNRARRPFGVSPSDL